MMLVKLEEMMRRRGMRTQGDLAELTGLNKNSISALKKGRGRLESVERLCAGLDCQPGDLLEYVPSEKEA